MMRFAAPAGLMMLSTLTFAADSKTPAKKSTVQIPLGLLPIEWPADNPDPKDWGAFKTPELREVARSAPYMHDGSLKTLEEVVEFYDKGGKPNQNPDEKIKPLKLTDGQKMDLVAFLKSLNGEGWQKVTAPAAFPQ
jgi:cytochrome c peroxidase